MFECQFPNKTSCKSSLGCNACEVAWADEQDRLDELEKESKFDESLFKFS